jgi:DNA-binding winged helix-turn-helix (wHTH) protein/tetratricopeptide (TPR) repeat protein
LDELIRFGAFELDVASHRLQRDGEPVALPPKAVDALELLAGAPGRLHTRDALIEALWPGRVVEEQGLSQLVYLLRRTLGPRPDGGQWIVTAPKRGYRFEGEVERAQQAPLARPARRDLPTVALLPLAEVACAEAGLGLALADALVTLLARHPALVVRPIGSLQVRHESAVDPAALGRELGVDLLVEGSLQSVGDALRANIRLWGDSGARLLWSERFDSRLVDLFALEDRIGDALLQQVLPDAAALAPMLARRSISPRVRAHLLQGRLLWHRWNPAAWRQAIDEARAALALEPDSAEARYWWGVSLCTLAITGQIEADAAFRQARALFHAAARLDPQFQQTREGLAAVALFHDWDLPTAIDLLRQAILASPGIATSRDLYGLALAASGDAVGAIREIDGALQIDPLSSIVGTDSGYSRVFARRFAEAVPAFRRVLQRDPGFSHARLYLGLALAWLGEGVAAQAEIRRALADCGRDPACSHELAHALVRSGEPAAALAILQRLKQLDAGRYVDPFEIASTCIALGRLDEAMQWLDKALQRRSRSLSYIRVEPIFDPLRGREDFAALVERVYPPALA